MKNHTQTNTHSSQDNMLEFFKNINYLEWTDLKKALQCLKETDTVKHIEENILYTEGKNSIRYFISTLLWDVNFS